MASDEEEPAQDDKFDPYGGEEEDRGTDDIERHTEGDADASPDEQDEEEADRFEQADENQSRTDEEEIVDPEYHIWNPNDASHNPPPDSHAIVSCSTTAGPLLMHFHRAWSPHGYERATTLFEQGYYDHSHFFRVVPHFLVQFGIGYNIESSLKSLASTSIPDDPKRQDLLPFQEGMMSFAGRGPNSRTSQLFIAYDKATNLGTSPWETPFGQVANEESLTTVRNLYSGYGDMPPWGKGPEQGPIHNRGSVYIEENFPKLDKFHRCTVTRVSEISDTEDYGEEAIIGATADAGENVAANNVGGNVRKSKGNGGGVDAKMMEKQPMMKLLLLIGGIVVAIVLVGLRGRRKKKANKSV
jgi:cyclophilin family peptidyl-prolyl cis-trans isomerase